MFIMKIMYIILEGEFCFRPGPLQVIQGIILSSAPSYPILVAIIHSPSLSVPLTLSLS